MKILFLNPPDINKVYEYAPNEKSNNKTPIGSAQILLK
jgi:hypothetical protein|tara:strand:+ start:604 stop:717 length:114 start_codon:yes stop_codon:yes gene_type:complete